MNRQRQDSWTSIKKWLCYSGHRVALVVHRAQKFVPDSAGEWPTFLPPPLESCSGTANVDGIIYLERLPSYSLQWRHNGHDGVSNQQPYDCLLNCLFGHRLKKTPKLRVTCLCAGNLPVTGEFPAQMASNAENVYIRWRHHVETWSWFLKSEPRNKQVNKPHLANPNPEMAQKWHNEG